MLPTGTNWYLNPTKVACDECVRARESIGHECVSCVRVCIRVCVLVCVIYLHVCVCVRVRARTRELVRVRVRARARAVSSYQRVSVIVC